MKRFRLNASLSKRLDLFLQLFDLLSANILFWRSLTCLDRFTNKPYFQGVSFCWIKLVQLLKDYGRINGEPCKLRTCSLLLAIAALARALVSLGEGRVGVRILLKLVFVVMIMVILLWALVDALHEDIVQLLCHSDLSMLQLSQCVHHYSIMIVLTYHAFQQGKIIGRKLTDTLI